MDGTDTTTIALVAALSATGGVVVGGLLDTWRERLADNRAIRRRRSHGLAVIYKKTLIFLYGIPVRIQESVIEHGAGSVIPRIQFTKELTDVSVDLRLFASKEVQAQYELVRQRIMTTLTAPANDFEEHFHDIAGDEIRRLGDLMGREAEPLPG